MTTNRIPAYIPYDAPCGWWTTVPPMAEILSVEDGAMTTQQIGNCQVHPYIKAQTFQLCEPCVAWLRSSFHDDQYKAAAWDFADPGRMFHVWVQWSDDRPAYPFSSTYGYSKALEFLDMVKGEVSWATIQHLGRTVADVQNGQIKAY